MSLNCLKYLVVKLDQKPTMTKQVYTVLQKYAHIGLNQNLFRLTTFDIITRLFDNAAFVCVHVVGRFSKDFSKVRGLRSQGFQLLVEWMTTVTMRGIMKRSVSEHYITTRLYRPSRSIVCPTESLLEHLFYNQSIYRLRRLDNQRTKTTAAGATGRAQEFCCCSNLIGQELYDVSI